MIRFVRTLAHLCLFVGIAIGLLAGCASGPKLVTVNGKVLLKDGTPVKNGTVTFHPDTSKGNQSKEVPIGAIRDGEYAIKTGVKDGAPLGAYRVSISAADDVNPDDPYKTVWYADEKYVNVDTSKLTADVTDNPEPGRYDFKLDPHPKAKKK